MEPDPSGLRSRLERIPGLDIEAGLSTTGGRIESLARLLRKYESSHGDDGPAFLRAWESGDLAAAHRLAHSVASAAGFLGLRNIRERAAALETAFLDPSTADDFASLIAAFSRENDTLCAALRAAGASPAEPGA